MKTKIIACPTNVLELESLSKFAIKNFSESKDVGFVFVLKSSDNRSHEMFQKVKEQADIFELVNADEKDTIDQMIILGLSQLNGADALMIRSMSGVDNWEFLIEMMDCKKKGSKIVLLKQTDRTKLEKFMDDAAVFSAKNLLGVRLFDESIFASLFDNELIKLGQKFPAKMNMIVKTNSLFGYEKTSIEKTASTFPQKPIFDTKKETILFLAIASAFVVCLLVQLLVDIFAGSSLPFNMVFLLVNFALLVSGVVSFSSLCIKRKVGKLLL